MLEKPAHLPVTLSPAGRLTRGAVTSQPGLEPVDRPIPFGYYLHVVRRHAWQIAVFIAVSMTSAYLVSAHMQPIYESTAVIDIDWLNPLRVVGEDPSRPGSANDAETFLSTQTRLIKSNAVLRPVAEKFQLGVEGPGKNVRPTDPPTPIKTSITLRSLSVSRQPNTYLIDISYRSASSQVAADIANAVAESYIARTNELRVRSAASLTSFMETQLGELKGKMDRSERTLAQFQKELDVIDPQQKTSIVSTRLVQLNTEFTNAQVDRVRKQSLYNSIQSGSLEAAESSGQGEELARLNQSLNEALARFAELKTTYGSTHPEYQKAASRISELQRQMDETRAKIGQRLLVEYKEAAHREELLGLAVATMKTEFDRLNSRSFEYQRLEQEAAADKKLYEELVAKVKEAGINAGVQNSNIRIADPALPAAKPIFPKMSVNLLAAFMLASILGAVAAVAVDGMSTTFRNTDEMGSLYGTHLIGILPLSKEKPELMLPVSAGSRPTPIEAGSTGGWLRPAEHESDRMSPFQEAVRTLRNAILLEAVPVAAKAVLITSAGPGEGKTTTAVHLAVAHSDQKKRTLLVDADLRRPSVHRFFGLASETAGLSEVLTGNLTWRQVRRSVPSRSHLDVIVAGAPSSRAADLIGPTLGDLLDEFRNEYDFIVIDSPPFIGFAEPLQMASLVDGLVIVTSARKTSRKALDTMLASLGRFRSNVLGIVLNRAREQDGDYGYNAYYQRSSRSLNVS